MTRLRCNGVGRDKDCLSALQFYFNRRVTDDEMRYLGDVMRRAATLAVLGIKHDEAPNPELPHE